MGWIVLLGICFAPPIIAAIVVNRRGVKIEQKRSTGIIICHNIFVVSFFLSLMVAFIAIISGPSPAETAKGPSDLRLLPLIFPTLISVSTIGLWYKQKWGRICSLFVATLISVIMAYPVYGSLFLASYKSILQKCAFVAAFIAIDMVFIGMIYYLTRPKVKEQFK